MFFYLSKLFWTLAAPGNLLLALGLLGLILQLRPGLARTGRRLTAGALLAFLLAAIFPIGNLVRAPLEDRFPAPAALPDKVDGIVVLGGAADTLLTERRSQPTLNDGAERLFALASLARRYPDAKVVYSGGSGLVFAQEYKESEVVRGVLASIGFDSGRILFESQSRNTYENAMLSRDLVRPSKDETWILVTSAYHMPRSVGIFRAVDWAVIPFPVDYRTGGIGRLVWPLNLHDGLSGLEIAMREWIGLAAYWAPGRSEAFFPKP